MRLCVLVGVHVCLIRRERTAGSLRFFLLDRCGSLLIATHARHDTPQLRVQLVRGGAAPCGEAPLDAPDVPDPEPVHDPQVHLPAQARGEPHDVRWVRWVLSLGRLTVKCRGRKGQRGGAKQREMHGSGLFTRVAM